MAVKSLDLSKLLGVPDLGKHLGRVQMGLEAALPADNNYLSEPALRLIRAGGKRQRPALIIAIVESQGRPITDRVITGCVAIELLHIASLVHDDIIDAATTRWNVSTISDKDGRNQAILVGDFLFAKALDLAAQIDASDIVAKAFVDMCAGQALEMSDRFNQSRSVESYLKAIQGKTAALMSAACQVGVRLSELPDMQVETMARYGLEFGMAFQLVDDILDLFSTQELLGKPAGNDVVEGVYTLPVLYSLQGQNGKKLSAHLLKKPVDSQAVARLLLDDNSLQASVELTLKHTSQASLALKSLNYHERLGSLSALPRYYVDWALDNLLPRAD